MKTKGSLSSPKHTPFIPFLSQINPVHGPYPLSWRSILLLSSHLLLDLPFVFFPYGFRTKTLCASIIFPICATCPTNLIIPDQINRTIFVEHYKSCSFSLCIFLHSPVTSFLLDPNIFLSTIFSNTLSLYFSLNMRDQVSHPHIYE